MSERNHLKEGDTLILYGESDNRTFQRTFTIDKSSDNNDGEGAFSICYEANYEGGNGTLKEFYPIDEDNLYRQNRVDGRLIHSEDANEYFDDAEALYIKPYKNLSELRKSQKYKDLFTFIPHFEIYYNYDPVEEDNPNGTVYIWTPQQKLYTFDKLCNSIHQHPDDDPENKLNLALKAIKSLVECIMDLHDAGMIHRDIKPSNFGFTERDNKPVVQNLSIFDVNTICPVDEAPNEVIGTPGYLEPEATSTSRDYRACYQTDIYAIGATLFNAIVVTDETEMGNYLYDSEYYDSIKDMVRESRLIESSDKVNSNGDLVGKITELLKKCLCKREERYKDCKSLLEDINNIVEKDDHLLADKKPSLNIEKEKNEFLAIQYHLYEHPLYKDCDEKTINVLVVGFEKIGQKFLDACLQDGQIRDKDLSVTVVYNNPAEREAYLKERPEMANFFNVDGSFKKLLEEKPELNAHFNADGSGKEEIKDESTLLQYKPYGNIIFQDGSKKDLDDIILDYVEKNQPHYVFISSLDGDSHNKKAAERCSEDINMLEKAKCAVSYVCQEEGTSADEDSNLYPLYIYQDVTKLESYENIERMAFNTNLVWEKDLNIDFAKTRNDFNEEYNHDSSVSNVLSLKYKLYSIGIDLDKTSLTDAAREFTNIMTNSEDRDKLRNELIWVEHRRWVVEKICGGYKKRNIEDCLRDIDVFKDEDFDKNDGRIKKEVTKDKEKKEHVCILRSGPNQHLSKYHRSDTENKYEKWDKEPDNKLAVLDELDRMSVDLHRAYKKLADERKEDISLADNEKGQFIYNVINVIEEKENSKKVVAAFREWASCIKSIYNGDTEKVRLYNGLRASFIKELDSSIGGLNPSENAQDIEDQKRLSKNDVQDVKDYVKTFERNFYPILMSMEYRDWKQDDVALIDNIPFILTYTENAYMAVPFVYSRENKTKTFGNVAAATVVNPQKIIYLVRIEHSQDLTDFQIAMKDITNYMRKKHLRATVDVILIYKSSFSFNKDNIINKIKRSGTDDLGVERICKVDSVIIGEKDRISIKLRDYIKQEYNDISFFAVEKNDSTLSGILQDGGFYELQDNEEDTIAGYTFDSKNREFSDLTNCDMFGYIIKKPYITVADMFSFSSSYSKSDNKPEFFDDYTELWNLYKKNTTLWKELCTILENYYNNCKISFKKGNNPKQNMNHPKYYVVDQACYKITKEIIETLKTQAMLDNKSEVKKNGFNECRAVIYGYCEYESEYDSLFNTLLKKDGSQDIKYQVDEINHSVDIWYEDLKLKKVSVENKNNNTNNNPNRFNAILNSFKKWGYITSLELPNGKDHTISCEFAFKRYKDLLTKAGRILEIYTYHKAKSSGRFDDIECGYEVEWNEENLFNEFDCILTKGFNSLFVECKARRLIDQNFYYKLEALTKKVGINATAVLIADTEEEKTERFSSINDMERKRGEMLDIITISKQNDISKIDSILERILDGSYNMSEENI